MYIEPAAVFELNNDIKDLENAYQRELIRLLTALTDQLRPHLPDLRKAYTLPGSARFHPGQSPAGPRAGWRSCRELEQPAAHPAGSGVRHPVLALTFGTTTRPPAPPAKSANVVPLDLELTPRAAHAGDFGAERGR
ncbi:MAG: hypothetical protein WKG07_43095 [Hymenobacter sp.]